MQLNVVELTHGSQLTETRVEQLQVIYEQMDPEPGAPSKQSLVKVATSPGMVFILVEQHEEETATAPRIVALKILAKITLPTSERLEDKELWADPSLPEDDLGLVRSLLRGYAILTHPRQTAPA